MAVATIPFLFDRSFNIYGGNLLSTMAGEFANSLGLTFAVVFFGVAARHGDRSSSGSCCRSACACRTHPSLRCLLLARVSAGAVARPAGCAHDRLARCRRPTGRSALGVLGAPFFWNRSLLNDMGWGKERRYVAALWDRSGSFGDQTFLANDPPLQVLIVLAVIGAVLCGVRRVRFGMAMTMVAVAFAALFLLLPEVDSGTCACCRTTTSRSTSWLRSRLPRSAACSPRQLGRSVQAARLRRCFAPAVLASLVVFIAFGLTLRSLPGGSVDDQGRYSWLGVFQTTERHLGPLWAAHNFNGYERTGAYPVLADGRDHGRGRSGVRLWPGPVGVPERTPRLVRHADGSDAVAALDRWLHRFDGRSVLRGVGYHPVSLPAPVGTVDLAVAGPA